MHMTSTSFLQKAPLLKLAFTSHLNAPKVTHQHLPVTACNLFHQLVLWAQCQGPCSLSWAGSSASRRGQELRWWERWHLRQLDESQLSRSEHCRKSKDIQVGMVLQCLYVMSQSTSIAENGLASKQCLMAAYYTSFKGISMLQVLKNASYWLEWPLTVSILPWLTRMERRGKILQ